jgi:hypothetical protein
VTFWQKPVNKGGLRKVFNFLLIISTGCFEQFFVVYIEYCRFVKTAKAVKTSVLAGKPAT